MKRLVLLLLLGLCLSVLAPAVSSQTPRQFGMVDAFNRIPNATWDTVAFTDISATMQQLGETWSVEDGALNATQEAGWLGVWKPDLLAEDTAELGFTFTEVQRVVEARNTDGFVIWLEGDFDTVLVAQKLATSVYEPIESSPIEAYGVVNPDDFDRLAPFIGIPDGHTLIIASSAELLGQTLDIYDGRQLPVVVDDQLLQWLGDLVPHVTSGLLRFDRAAKDCAVESSRVVMHGLGFDTEREVWQYWLHIGYPSETIVTDINNLGEGLEYSTLHVRPYEGVLGQHTRIHIQDFYESSAGSILGFVSDLRPDEQMQNLPFQLAKQANTCDLFGAPQSAAIGLALDYLPDLSAGRTAFTVRYGNAEQALYNANVVVPMPSPPADLTPRQVASLNGTWRTDLIFEEDFAVWFGFSPMMIRQTAEMTISSNEYVRVIWGDFLKSDVETAFSQTGYVAVEQHAGTRIFSLRNAPESGGFLLSSLAQVSASPMDGVLMFSNSFTNMRLALDIYEGSFSSGLDRNRDFVMLSRGLGDATNVIMRRYPQSLSGGLVCGLPPYRSEAFANVLYPDGWHFVYGLGFVGALEDPEIIVQRLAAALETSDYPMQGPGSETFGNLSSVVDTRIEGDANYTVLLVDLIVTGSDQQSSLFGQDFANATLPPCVLGDVNQ